MGGKQQWCLRVRVGRGKAGRRSNLEQEKVAGEQAVSQLPRAVADQPRGLAPLCTARAHGSQAAVRGCVALSQGGLWCS